MPAPSNLSFETQGLTAGTAQLWSLSAIATYEELAGFSGGLVPWETFESGWSTPDVYQFSFEPTDLAHAEYDTIIVDFVKQAENFEELWQSNESYLTELTSPEPELASYVRGTGNPNEPWENFEEAWDANEGWMDAFAGVGVDLTEGDFDAGTGGQQDETFTTWATGYLTSFVGIGSDLTAALYNGGALSPVEAFASEQAPREFSVNLTTDVLTLVGSNPFVDTQKVFVTAEGTFPAPLQSSQTYFVRDTSGLTNKLTLAPAGVAIDITGTATGRVYLTGDPVLYWTEKMVTTAF